MSDDFVSSSVRSYSSGLPGRSINEARNHHFVIDSPSINDEINSIDAFLAGISSCGVNLIEIAAKEAGVPISRMDVTIEGRRRRDKPAAFAAIEMLFTIQGPTQEQAAELVQKYKDR